MPGESLRPTVDSRYYQTSLDLEVAEKANLPVRASLVNCLRTSGCVFIVAAAGFIAYHVLGTFSGGGAPLLSLLASTHTRGLEQPPKGDSRKYQHTVLANGLQVVNVQDTRSVTTAFAMAIEAGSYDDPKSLPGLAHFCEHMLFLGTEKYPEASGFDNFMSANGGSNNAYTADEVTVYFGELSKAAGEEGQDRFADFFRAPLFGKKYVTKEVQAINSEHAKNVQDPTRRILAVVFSLANPDSPMGAFHTGDADTLIEIPKSKGVDTVDELKVWFQSHYCPTNMRLVTYSSDPLSKQLADASKDFGSLVTGSSCKAKRKSFAKPEAWGPARMGQFVQVRGTLPQAELWLHFTLPDLTQAYDSQPLSYLDHVLGYSGTDSLKRVLQDNLGLVTSFSTMFAAMNSAGTSMIVMMHLTKPGQSNMELILDVFYAYLSKLRKKGVDEKLYDSLARVNKLQWDWDEPQGASDTASTLAERMIRLPVDKLLSGDNLIGKSNSSLVSSLIEALTPANMNVIYVEAASKKGNSSSFISFPEEDFKMLPHYAVKYAVQTNKQQFSGAAQRWKTWITGSASPDVASRLPSSLITSGTVVPVVPGPIEDVPSELPLEHMKAAKGKKDLVAQLFGTRPTKLSGLTPKKATGVFVEHEPGFLKDDGEVFYRSGWSTTSPKAQVQLVLRPERQQGAPEMSAHDDLPLSVFGSLLAEAMVPGMVDLASTGVSYSIDATPKGLTFSFSGFTPLMPTLITKVMKEFNGFNGNASATLPSRFKRVTQSIREGMQAYADMPISYAIQDRNLLLTRGMSSRAESLKALDEVTRESAASSVNNILLSKPLRLTSLVMGNVDEEEARKAITTCIGSLHTPSRTEKDVQEAGEPERVMPVVKLVKPVEIRKKNPRVGDSNDAVVLSLIAGVSTVQSRVVLGILGQILSAVAYNELRTAKQLGYVVNAGTSQVSNVQYVSCVVQGNALKADSVEAAIEHVLTHLMPKRLLKLTDKEFAAHKDSFRQDLLRPPVKFADEVNHFWGPVVQGGQCFDLRSNMVRYLDESLKSKDALVEAWTKLATPAKGTRSKMVVKYFANSVPSRPTLANATSTWKKQGVAESSLSLLAREYEQTQIFDRADSKTRQQLVKEGGYFPLDMNCDLAKSVQVPSPHFLMQASRHGELSE